MFLVERSIFCTSITRIVFLSLWFKLGIFQYILPHENVVQMCANDRHWKAVKYLCSVVIRNECVLVLVTTAEAAGLKQWCKESTAYSQQQPFMFNYYCNLVEIHTAQSIGTHAFAK